MNQRLKESDSFNSGFVLMQKVPVIKMLLKQQNERKNEKDCVTQSWMQSEFV